MEQELRTKAYNGIKSNPTHAFASFDFWVDNEKNTYWSAFAHFVDRQWKAHTILLFQQCLTSKPLETFQSELDQLLKCNCISAKFALAPSQTCFSTLNRSSRNTLRPSCICPILIL